MLFVMVTHADPDYSASSVLTDKGREGTRQLAILCRGKLPCNAVPVLVMSSPRTRCIETAIILVSELGRGGSIIRFEHGKPWDDIPATRVHVMEELDALETTLSAAELQNVIRKGFQMARPQAKRMEEQGLSYEPVVIVALHADLAGTLGMEHSRFTEYVDEDGFFKRRPVLLVLNYGPECDLSEYSLRCDSVPLNIYPEDDAKLDPLYLGTLNVNESRTA